MSLSYVRPDDEFFGCIKLTNGEEILARCIVAEESPDNRIVFVQDPAKVHATETIRDDKRAIAVGLKKWMVFSDEEFYIIPEQRVLTIAPMSIEAIAMYKIFCKTELDSDYDLNADRGAELDPSMGYIGNVDDTRKKLEDIFKLDT
jgi:hypothetical protein